MKKNYLLILLSCTIFFQSCFDIVEQLQLNNDGSGNIQVTLNLSQSKTKLNSISKLTTINGHPVPTQQDINAKISEIKTTLEQTPGITAVKITTDYTNYIGIISYNFSSITQLNKSIKNVAIKEKAKPDEVQDYYSYDATKKIFSRNNKFDFKKLYATISNADKEIFSTATYASIFRFQSTINNTTNKDAKISPGKNAIMLKGSALDFITAKKTIDNKINLN